MLRKVPLTKAMLLAAIDNIRGAVSQVAQRHAGTIKKLPRHTFKPCLQLAAAHFIAAPTVPLNQQLRSASTSEVFTGCAHLDACLFCFPFLQVMICYPMGLPEWDFVRQCLEWREDLTGTDVIGNTSRLALVFFTWSLVFKRYCCSYHSCHLACHPAMLSNTCTGTHTHVPGLRMCDTHTCSRKLDPLTSGVPAPPSHAQFGGEDLDPATSQLWFASRALAPDKPLSEYVGRNERTKAVVKLTKKGAGAPAREPVRAWVMCAFGLHACCPASACTQMHAVTNARVQHTRMHAHAHAHPQYKLSRMHTCMHAPERLT